MLNIMQKYIEFTAVYVYISYKLILLYAYTFHAFKAPIMKYFRIYSNCIFESRNIKVLRNIKTYLANSYIKCFTRYYDFSKICIIVHFN